MHGADPAGLDGRDGGRLVDRHASGLDGTGQATGQARRLDGRAVRREEGAEHAVGADASPGLAAVEPAHVLVAEAELAALRRASACSRASWSGAVARWSVAPLAKLQSMPSSAAARPTSSTVSCIVRCSEIAASRPCRSAIAVEAHRQQAGAPAAVAARRPEAGDVALEHRDAQVRVGRRRGSSAVHSPVKPAPTMATSTSRGPGSGGRGTRASSSSWSSQSERER